FFKLQVVGEELRLVMPRPQVVQQPALAVHANDARTIVREYHQLDRTRRAGEHVGGVYADGQPVLLARLKLRRRGMQVVTQGADIDGKRQRLQQLRRVLVVG